MIDILHREGVYLWFYASVQFKQIFRYWALGILLGSAISVFGKGKINSLLLRLRNSRMGVLGVVPASLLGIASPLCMFGTIPIAASLSDRGLRHDWLAAFMMSSMLLNPQLIFYSAALGPTALIVRCTSCLLCGIIAGLLVRLFYRNKPFFSFKNAAESVNHDTDPHILWRFIKNVGRNVKATGLYFVIGIALSALYQRYVPQDAFASLFGWQEGFGVLLAATIGVPLYVCGGGTIPLLQEWLWDGMSMDAAAAFMITGPATKITNLGALKMALGAKRFALYLAFVMIFSLITGGIINLIL